VHFIFMMTVRWKSRGVLGAGVFGGHVVFLFQVLLPYGVFLRKGVVKNQRSLY
jgi:hypothetical protein